MAHGPLVFMYNHSFAQMCLLIGIVSRVSDVAHGALVVIFFVYLGRAFTRSVGVFFVYCIQVKSL